MKDIESLNAEKINKNVELWKKKLLDFTRRNNLIYFKYSRKNNLKINNEPSEIFNLLIDEENDLIIKELDLEFDDTPESQRELDKVLGSLRTRSNSVLKEKGVNILYLCLGMLKWRESDNSKIDVYSPILLLPVQIIKKGKNQPFLLTTVDNEYTINNTLMYKMRMDFGIELFEENDDISNIDYLLDNIKNKIKGIENWSVLDDVYLGTFSFNKISMYRDLERYENEIYDHEIVSKLASSENIYNSYELEEIEKLPLEKKAEEIYQVLDADSSQQKTLVMSKQGYSFVIEGPPGTGKSQTISNIIAEAIAQDKTVLFVSEKVAALEVVANRLTAIGLGDYILELHSNKANKKKVVSDIYSQYIRQKEIKTSNNTIFFNEIENNIKNLDSYVSELHKKHKPLDKNAYELHGELSALSSIQDIPYKIDNYHDLTIEQIIDMRNIVKELEYKREQLYKYKESLWKDTLLYECNLQKQKEIEAWLFDIINNIEKNQEIISKINIDYDLNIDNLEKIFKLKSMPSILNKASIYNYSYFNEDDIERINEFIVEGRKNQIEYRNINDTINRNYGDIKEINKYKNKDKILAQIKLALGDNIYTELIQKDTLNNIKVITKEIVALLTKLDENYNYINNIFGEEFKPTISKFQEYKEVFNILPRCKSVPVNWFNNIENLIKINNEVLPEIKGEIEDLIVKISNLEDNFKDDLYKEDITYLLKLINYCKDTSINNKAKELYELKDFSKDDFDKFESCIENLNALARELFSKLNINSTVNVSNLYEVIKIVDLIEETKYFNKTWFDSNQILILNNLKDKISKSINELNEKKKEINNIFKETIYNIDYQGCYNRFCSQYIGKLRFINSNYKKDKNSIERCLIDPPKKITYELLLEYLEKMVMFDKAKEKFEELESNYVVTFGPLMNGIDTDIKQLEKTIANVEVFINLWNKFGQPKEILDFAVKEKAQNEIIDISARAKHHRELYDALITKLSNQYNIDTEFRIKSFEEQLKVVKRENIIIKNIIEDFEKVNSLCVTGKLPLEEFMILIEDALDIRKNIETLNQKESQYKELFGKYYRGLNTDWNELEDVIKNTINIEKVAKVLNTQEKNSLIKYISNDLEDEKPKLKETINSLDETSKNVDLILDKFIKLNNKDKSIYEKEVLATCDLNITYSLFNELNLNIELFSEVLNNLLSQRYTSFNSIEEVSADLINLNILIDNEERLLNLENTYSELFGASYKRFDTDWNSIEENVRHIRKIIEEFESVGIKISETFKCKIVDINEKNKIIDRIPTDSLSILEELINKVLSLLNERSLRVNDTKLISLEINNCKETLQLLKEQVADIELIIKIRNIVNEGKKLGIEDFINRVLNTSNIDDSYIDIFNKGIYTMLLDNIYKSSMELRNFDKERFKRTLNEFKSNDKKLIKINTQRIKEILDNRIILRLKDINARKQLALLDRENSKKKRHLPLRTLFSSIPDVIKTLKPCIMMSPLSVSEYIDLKSFKFDMVIFDEASQICPEDAIGAMLRGNQIIIAGDKKQLPPTKFFSTISEESEEYDNDDEPKFEELFTENDYESILDLASTFMHSSRLLWHYRSRHESLITFSNKNFYDNTLYTFPSTENNENLGVQFEYVEGIYDQGGSSTNIIEARKVAQLVINHFKKSPNRSLGVITFGTKQMDCINDMIEEIRISYPELDKYFDEEKENPFFVKNLENVQGDERDTIILSVCYGYSDSARKKLSHNFGPINKAGGERRLNVAITRAKYQLIVVSSIKDGDIDLGRTSSIGARLLKEYLYFARVGKLPESLIVDRKKRFDSPLEEDIYNELIKLGYEVDTQVGCSGYRIDLAIKDPNQKGNYLMGIECDGATYHSSKSARDRDRLRQEVLEGLGWNIHRIWSQDWFKNKYNELVEVRDKVNNILSGSIR